MQKSILKIGLLLLAITCQLVSLQAQSYRDMYAGLSYLQLPFAPLEGNFKTYSITIDEMELKVIDYGLRTEEILPKKFTLEQYELVDKDGDFEIIIELGKANYIGKTAQKGTERVKNKAGEYVEKVYYYYDLAYNLPCKLSIYDGKRQLMREKIFYKRGEELYRSYGKAGSLSKLATTWKADEQKYIYETYKRELNYIFKISSEWLQAQIDTRFITLKDADFLTIKKPEKYGAEKITQAIENIVKMEEAGKFKRSPEEVMPEITPNLEALKQGLNNFSPDNKKEKKIYFITAFTLAKMYTYLHQPAEGKVYFEKAQAAMDGFRAEGLVKDFIPILKDMERRVAANKDVPQKYVGSFDAVAAAQFAKDYQAARQAELSTLTEAGTVAEVIDSNAFLITNKRDTLRGQIEYDWKDREGITKFYVFETGNREATEQQLKPDEVLLVHRNGKNYANLGFLPSYDVILPIIALAEITYVGKKASLYVFEHPDKSAYDHIVYNAKTKKLTNLDGDRFGFNFNKQFAKYLIDCPTVSKLAAEGEYEQTTESLLKAIEAYNSCE
ncbi:MAG: hypothetical protein AAF927_01540 [Bacteroidota bacterium]